MSFDAHGNLAIGKVLTAPSPAASGLTLTLRSGEGALFPATPFNVTVWPDAEAPFKSNSTILRVTDVTGDVMTFQRTQEGSSERSILVGDWVANSVTTKVLTDIEAVLPSVAAGSPEGAVTRSPGATHLDSTTDNFWLKKTGTGNTGWVPILTNEP